MFTGTPQSQGANGSPRPHQLLLSPQDASSALAISERTLWRWTKRGLIPHIKIGRLTRYPVDALCAWIEEGQIYDPRFDNDDRHDPFEGGE